jgi:DNA transformation protein
MSVQPRYLAWVLEQMAGLGGVSTRRMFGAVGLYSAELFFGLIDDDTLFFKTDASNHADYLARRMPRFMAPAKAGSPKGYHQVPADVIEDAETLVDWARKAIAVARTTAGRQRVPGRARQPAARKTAPASKPRPARRKARAARR